jgi:hypothetical protein
MQSKLLNVDPPVTYAVVLDTGDEVAAGLGRFVRDHAIEVESVTAIGGFRSALLGSFDWVTKAYRKIAVDEQVEVLSLLGDVAVAKMARACTSTRFSARRTAQDRERGLREVGRRSERVQAHRRNALDHAELARSALLVGQSSPENRGETSIIALRSPRSLRPLPRELREVACRSLGRLGSRTIGRCRSLVSGPKTWPRCG